MMSTSCWVAPRSPTLRATQTRSFSRWRVNFRIHRWEGPVADQYIYRHWIPDISLFLPIIFDSKKRSLKNIVPGGCDKWMWLYLPAHWVNLCWFVETQCTAIVRSISISPGKLFDHKSSHLNRITMMDWLKNVSSSYLIRKHPFHCFILVLWCSMWQIANVLMSSVGLLISTVFWIALSLLFASKSLPPKYLL
jgi:hypothetical protein